MQTGNTGCLFGHFVVCWRTHIWTRGSFPVLPSWALCRLSAVGKELCIFAVRWQTTKSAVNALTALTPPHCHPCICRLLASDSGRHNPLPSVSWKRTTKKAFAGTCSSGHFVVRDLCLCRPPWRTLKKLIPVVSRENQRMLKR